MSWLIPFWRKEQPIRTFKNKVIMVLFWLFLFSPSITFVTLYGTFGYPMEITVIFTTIHIMISVVIIVCFVMREFMSFIFSLRKELVGWADKDRLTKADLYSLLDVYYDGWNKDE